MLARLAVAPAVANIASTHRPHNIAPFLRIAYAAVRHHASLELMVLVAALAAELADVGSYHR
jgi:hypothetical protein